MSDNTPQFTALPPLSLYIHIPWCVRKCPYCDFNSHAVNNVLDETAYIDCLLADLTEELPFVQGRPLLSIFFGGGTPSLFSATGIEQILKGVNQRIPFADTIEITLEANPGTVEQEKFRGFYQAGVNRLSIGVQSFQEQQLQALGRIHNSNEAITAIQAAQTAGFSNINIDLMHGLPEQTVTAALADLQQAIDLKPAHISWYQLTIEPNTAFYKKPPALPDEDRLSDIQDRGDALLKQHGFKHYEISAYSQPNKQAAHNLNYWQFGDYLGIGAGAHGKITSLDQQHIIRRQKTRLPKDYMNTEKTFCANEKVIAPEDIVSEFMMNALRLNHGFHLDLFEQRSGLPTDAIKKAVNQLIKQGLLIEDNDVIATTAQGKYFLNDVLAAFI